MTGEREPYLDVRDNVDWKDARKPRRMVLSPPEEVAEHDRRALGTGVEAETLKRLWTEIDADKPLREMPLEIMVEKVGAVCDMECPMCYLQSDEFNRRVRIPLVQDKSTIMSHDLFEKIIEEVGDWNRNNPVEERVLSMKFGFRGEPTLDKRLLDSIELAQNAGIYYTTFLTNGHPMTDEFFKRAMYIGVNEIIFSGEGYSKETYEKVRAPAKWDEFHDKLSRWKRMRDDAGSDKPAMRIQSVWPGIQDNPSKFYEIYKDKVDLVASNALIDYLHNDAPDKIAYIPDFKCYEPFQRLIIAGNGQVLQCVNDEYSNNIVGDVRNSSLYEVWHGDGMNKLRESHKNISATKDYEKTCGQCYLPRQIEWIEPITVEDRQVQVFRYVGRSQEIGK